MSSENHNARPVSARKLSPPKKNVPKSQDAAPATNAASDSASPKQIRADIALEMTMKDFFDFMKTAYQVYETVEGTEENVPSGLKIDWDELEKNPVVKMMMDLNTPESEDYPVARRGSEGGAALECLECGPSSSFFIADIDPKDPQSSGKFKKGELRRNSLGTFCRKSPAKRDSNTDLDETGIDSLLLSKLSEVLNEGILDSVLSYMVGRAKPPKTKNIQQPIIKKPVTFSTLDLKKPVSFSGFSTERESKEKVGISARDKLGRRKSSLGGDKYIPKGDSEVEIHVCDEVKGLKRDFRCPQKLLVTKMGYFADVTSGQKLEDMDISVHCDIQIFDWLMRWVKKDTILVADWPLLDPTNVVPILVSASFLQMDPLLHDCLIYCHSHMSDIVKTNTNLACLNDTILTRLGAMYTNSELESIKDKKDKIQSRLFCKMIMSLGEPVPETLRGHYSSLATLYKCSSCSKLLSKQIADRVPCQSSNMSIDHRGHILSAHTRDLGWNLSEYITGLYGELKSWRKVYWRLWGECHFLKCSTCDNNFPVHQMEWCCYHADMPQFFSPDPTKSTCLPIGRYPCCSQRAYRFQILNHTMQGCQFRDHTPKQSLDHDVAVLAIYAEFKSVIATRPPEMVFPEQLIRLLTRDNDDTKVKLSGTEVFWWQGLKLAPPRRSLGLLGKLYSGNISSKPNLNKQQASSAAGDPSTSSTLNCAAQGAVESSGTDFNKNADTRTSTKVVASGEGKGCASKTDYVDDSSSTSSSSSDTSSSSTSSSSSSGESSRSEESSPQRPAPSRCNARRGRQKVLTRRRAGGGGGRHWAAALSARSNQDHQRQYEERAARQMRALLSRPVSNQIIRQEQPMGGVYVRLEAEWRESLMATNSSSTRALRQTHSAKGPRSKPSK